MSHRVPLKISICSGTLHWGYLPADKKRKVQRGECVASKDARSRCMGYAD